MPRALVVGDVMTDIVAQLDTPFARGSDAPARIVERPGGSAATFAVRLAQAGVDVDFVGRVAAGDVERLSAEFRAEGVTPWLAGDPYAATGRLVAVVEPSGERSFFTDRGANDSLRETDIPDALIADADWVHLTGYSFQHPVARAAARGLIVRSAGRPVSVDPGSAVPLREMGVLNFLEWTKGAGLLFPNADEASALTGTDDPAGQREKLRGRYPLVVVKRGAGGAEAMSVKGVWEAPAPKVTAVDTTGAGDAFAAAFVAWRLSGADVPRCLAEAVAAGTAATGQVGGRA
jgi:sugar/nucleoside kinase (ribokinase family)